MILAAYNFLSVDVNEVTGGVFVCTASLYWSIYYHSVTCYFHMYVFSFQFVI